MNGEEGKWKLVENYLNWSTVAFVKVEMDISIIAKEEKEWERSVEIFCQLMMKLIVSNEALAGAAFIAGEAQRKGHLSYLGVDHRSGKSLTDGWLVSYTAGSPI